MKITKDPKFLNAVVNNPQVKKGACPNVEGEVDLTDLMLSSEDLFIIEFAPYGGFVLQQNDLDSYICHTLFLPKTPSSAVLEAVEQSLWFMFIEMDAKEIWSNSCESNVPAWRLMDKVGFETRFTSPSKRKDGMLEKFGVLDIHQYVTTRPVFAEEGVKFHDRVELVKGEENHPYDFVHDCYVGATAEMLRCANIDKGIEFYNKWAMLAGYATASYDQPSHSLVVGDLYISLDEEIITCQ